MFSSVANRPVPYNLNPVLWLDGNDPAGNQVLPANGSSVSTWVDKSGRGNNATQGTGAQQPIFVTNQQNGKPSLTFNASQYLSLPMNILADGNTPYTTVTVLNATNSAAQRYFLQLNGEAGVNNFLLQSFSSNAYGDSWFANDIYFPASAATTYAFASIYDVIDGRKLYFNSTNVVSDVSTDRDAVNISGNVVGAGFTNQLPFLGHISEILVFDYTLTTAQYQSVYGYLSAKWAV